MISKRWQKSWQIPSGKHTKSYGKSPFLMGKLTISMAIFNSYVSHNQRVAKMPSDQVLRDKQFPNSFEDFRGTFLLTTGS
jgi:hypothetical protein